ncbi:MAG: substrate-binding domain-containing protein, partial [Gallionella sp.]|nr:substrate-binding domain-containing protein [Gallionella sp.]
QRPLEEIKQVYEKRSGIGLNVIYAGSDTLLSTLKTTGKGDVFIPGSSSYLTEAGSLITSDQFVAMHTPVFAVHGDKLKTYADLLKLGVRIAVGNKDMAAIGRLSDAVLKEAPAELNFSRNIVVSASTVNELLKLVAAGEVDAALLWGDMLQWEDAKGLTAIALPPEFHQVKEIRVATLSSSLAPRDARDFADFVASEGRAVFEKHGFGRK